MRTFLIYYDIKYAHSIVFKSNTNNSTGKDCPVQSLMSNAGGRSMLHNEE